MDYDALIRAVTALQHLVQELRKEIDSLRAWNRFLVGLVLGLSLLAVGVMWALHSAGLSVKLAW